MKRFLVLAIASCVVTSPLWAGGGIEIARSVRSPQQPIHAPLVMRNQTSEAMLRRQPLPSLRAAIEGDRSRLLAEHALSLRQMPEISLANLQPQHDLVGMPKLVSPLRERPLIVFEPAKIVPVASPAGSGGGVRGGSGVIAGSLFDGRDGDGRSKATELWHSPFDRGLNEKLESKGEHTHPDFPRMGVCPCCHEYTNLLSHVCLRPCPSLQPAWQFTFPK